MAGVGILVICVCVVVRDVVWNWPGNSWDRTLREIRKLPEARRR